MAYLMSGATFDRVNPADFGITGFVKKAFTYIASGVADDDDIATISYYTADGISGAFTLIGVLTFTYAGSTNNIVTITRTT